MDKSTIESLISTYSAAPSDDLARIIALGLVELEDMGRAREFFSRIESSLTDTQAAEIFDKLIESNAADMVLPLLNTDAPAQALLAARCLLHTDKKEEARLVYLDIIEQHTELANDALNDEFGVLPPERIVEKPKLRVVEKSDVLDLSDFIEPPQAKVDFSNVVGLSKVKKQIERKIILPFKKPSMYQRFKKKVGGGVLLYGPPGCGKTLIARATAGQAQASFINVQISDVLDMYIGESERKLLAIFEKARSEVPSVLFFDELEALAGKREYGRNSSSANVVSQFLSELDGFSQNNKGVLVLASTNTPWAIDSAFLRPGRFDRMFFVPPPDKEARLGILELEMSDKPVANVDLAKIAARTSGFSGADISNLVETATDEAIEASIDAGEDVPLNQKHFDSALSELNATTSEWLTTARNYARYANEGGRYNDVLNFIKQHSK